MTDKITIDRSVIEQALEALGMMSTPSPLVFLPDEIQSWQNANEALRAALEQPQDHSEQHLDMVPAGWKLVPVEPTSEMIAAGKESMQYSIAELPAFTCYNAMLRAAPQPPTLEQPQVEQEPDGLSLVIAGAIYDFAGYITTRPKVIEVGSTANASPMADLVKEFAELRGLSLADAAVLSWQMRLKDIPQPPRQPLTEEEIRDLFQDQRAFPRLLKFIRVIEAAHGIKEQK